MDIDRETLQPPKPTVDVVYAGGTISSLVTPEGYREGGHVVDLVGQLEQHVPGLITLGETEVAYTGLSENIDAHYLDQISQTVAGALERNPHSVVLTHGTDSMEQTARFLQSRFIEQLRARNKRMIQTGANDDTSTPNTDVWDNLAFACISAAGDAEPGVYVAFHGKLIPADLVVKEPFNGKEMNYASREDPAYQEAVQQQQKQAQQLIRRLEEMYGHERSDGIVDYPVNVIRPNHQQLLDYVSSNPVRAVLLTLYHSGTANTESPETSVAELARKLSEERGIVSFAVTENGEPVNFGAYETSIKLKEASIVPLGNMLHDVALARLQLIRPDVEPEELKQEMQSPIE
jgi:L-asparaginase/Glu-tRNA(Gln) amidotransferase subunit D